MSVTKKDLKEYQNMLILLDELNDEIEQEYNTYKSPAFNRISSGSSHSNHSPQERALQRIQKLEKKRDDLKEQLEAIEDYVYSISDPMVMAICICHFLKGYTWEATCVHLRKHHSTSVVIEMVNKYFREHALSGDENQPTGGGQNGQNPAVHDNHG